MSKLILGLKEPNCTAARFLSLGVVATCWTCAVEGSYCPLWSLCEEFSNNKRHVILSSLLPVCT